MCMLADGALLVEDESALFGAASTSSDLDLVEPGVDEGEAAEASVMVTSVWVRRATEPEGLKSSEETAAPVFARLLCFCCSESEGDRERLRVESASGMSKMMYGKDQRQQGFKVLSVFSPLNAGTWDGGSGRSLMDRHGGWCEGGRSWRKGCGTEMLHTLRFPGLSSCQLRLCPFVLQRQGRGGKWPR